jgi:hypothetical protein
LISNIFFEKQTKDQSIKQHIKQHIKHPNTLLQLLLILLFIIFNNQPNMEEQYFPVFVYEEAVPHDGSRGAHPIVSTAKGCKLSVDRIQFIKCFHVIEASTRQLIITKQLHQV